MDFTILVTFVLLMWFYQIAMSHFDKIIKKLDKLQGDVNEYLNTRGE